MFRKDFGLAYADFQTALSLDEQHGPAHSGLALYHLEQNDPAEADAAAQRALAINPSDADAVHVKVTLQASRPRAIQPPPSQPVRRPAAPPQPAPAIAAPI